MSIDLTRRRPRFAMLVAVAAAAAAVAAIPAFASASAAAPGRIAAPVFPPTRVNFFYGELSPPNGSANWEWVSSTAPNEPFANTTSRAIVSGNITLGSANGAAVSGQLGVCYQQAGVAGAPIRFGNWELINFTAPKGTWVSQSITGTILPGTNGLPAGNYNLGLCVAGTSANLVYYSVPVNNAGVTGDVMIAEDSGP